MISIILLFLLVLIVILALVLRVTFKNQTKHFSNVLCITIPVLVVVFFVAIIAEKYYHRMVQEKELSSLNMALDYTLSPRLFKTDIERQNCIDSLMKYDLQINEISEWDSIISLFVGKDKIMSAQIERTNSVIKKQIRRYSILNKIDTCTYSIDKSELAEFKLLEPDNNELPVLNVAFVIREIPETARLALITLNKGDSISYQQFYELKDGINAFLFPNKFNDGVELHVGYITEQDKENTFHYKRYKPHV